VTAQPARAVLKRAALNLGLAATYSCVFVLVYKYFLNFYFDYAGYTLVTHGSVFIAWSVFISILPVVCYRGMKGISSVLATFVFVLLYVPIVLTFSLGADRSLSEILAIQLVFAVSMSVLFLTDAIIVRSPLYLHTRTNLMPLVLALTVLATLYVALVYRTNLRFVSFGTAIYEQRFANSDLGTDALTRYLSSWLSTVFVPLCLAYGLVHRRVAYFLVGTMSCVILYMATAGKATILLPAVYGLLYVLLRHGRVNATYQLLTGGLSLLLTLLLLVRPSTDSVLFLVSSLILMRTIGNGGQLTMAYYDFFSTHAHTSYTHVNAVRALTGFAPYGKEGVGEVVGHYYWGMDVNANANFWATDGIAASGLSGVLLISAIAAVLFIVLNSVTRGYDRVFVILCFVPFLLFFLNTSLFSSVWSGGAVLLIGFFLIQPPTARSTLRNAIVVREKQGTG
jgi:hypothetical protein